MIGATQKVDVYHLRCIGEVRILVAVLDIKKIPKFTDVCVKGCMYCLFSSPMRRSYKLQTRTKMRTYSLMIIRVMMRMGIGKWGMLIPLQTHRLLTRGLLLQLSAVCIQERAISQAGYFDPTGTGYGMRTTF
jgi:hypothetical protein